MHAIKKEMRRTARAVRSEAFARLGAEAPNKIAQHGVAFAGRPSPAIVSAFLAIGEEIDPLPLMRRLASEGYGLALPVMEGKDKPLVFRTWAPGDPLAETMWGIREPLPEAPTVDPDIVLVPLLAYDALGYRVGYGGGFYDRTLAKLRALKPIAAIGLAFDEQKVDDVPHVDYDERLDWVLTPSGPQKCSGK